MFDLIIKNGACFIDSTLTTQDIAIKDSKIVKIGKINGETKDIYNAEGLTVLPGCIDTQTHFREPGSTDTEDLHSGSKAAIVIVAIIQGWPLYLYQNCFIMIFCFYFSLQLSTSLHPYNIYIHHFDRISFNWACTSDIITEFS